MVVNQHTKIAVLLRQHPGALEAITSISPTFEKLRNPFLRKLMAGRTSIRMAAKIAGCAEEDFFRVLKPLGFSTEIKENSKNATPEKAPPFVQAVKAAQLIAFDVRPLLEAGNDPLNQILARVKALQPGEALKIINTFEPTPLIEMLRKKGFQSWTNTLAPQHIETWFFRESAGELSEAPAGNEQQEGWEQVEARFAGRLQEVDVRELEMPLPMHTILEALEGLPEEKALFVHHKKMPLFLLPELTERGFDYRSRQLSGTEVKLLIFRS